MIKKNDVVLEQLEIGPMGNYMYFIGDQQTKEIGVVDPAWDVDAICSRADENGYVIRAILLTHGHMDHVNGAVDLEQRAQVPVYLSKFESDFYVPACKNLRLTADREPIKIGSIEIECIHTPGHSMGSQCFYFGDNLITGDTLFIDGCGRCDLPGGDVNQMYNSLYQIILKMPDETMIYSGHQYGPIPYATLLDQKRTNPYLTCQNKDEFVNHRMGF